MVSDLQYSHFYPPGCFPCALPPAHYQRRRDTVARIFEGLENSSLPLMPVLHVDKPLFETMTMLAGTRASILPTSNRKIERCKMLFDKWVDGGERRADKGPEGEGEGQVKSGRGYSPSHRIGGGTGLQVIQSPTVKGTVPP